MRNSWSFLSCFAFPALLWAAVPLPAAPPVVKSPAAFPLSFETAAPGSNARFIARGPGFSLALAPQRAAFSLSSRDAGNHPTRDTLFWSLRGADSKAAGQLLEPSGATSHYLLGNDPAQWRHGVPLHSKLRFNNVYPGVDLVYYGNDQHLEYDFILRPGADPHQIDWAFDAPASTTIDRQGNLVASAGARDIVLHRPVAWQQVEGARREVSVSFVATKAGGYGFELGEYDRTRELVIDPFLSFAAALGGSALESPAAVALDPSGNLIVVGYTFSADLTQLSAVQASAPQYGYSDALIARLSANGSTLLSCTYLGGIMGDWATAVGVDSAGNIYAAGRTSSYNFPTLAATQHDSAGGQNDGFLVKLNPSASALMFSTYLGGGSDDVIRALSVDPASGSVAVVGTTYSINFPVTLGPAVDISRLRAFAAVYSSTGVRTYSRLLSDQDADANAAFLSPAGTLWVTGSTASPTFPTTAGAFQTAPAGCDDAYLLALKPDGSGPLYSTLFGGPGCDHALAMAADATGNVYIGGDAPAGLPLGHSTPPFQPTPGGQQDGFVAKFDAAGQFQWATYLGGSAADAVAQLATDPAGNVIVSGTTYSADFPLRNPLQPAKLDGASAIYASSDNGASWSAPSGLAAIPASYYMNIVASPADPNLVFVRAAEQLFKSTDRGVTFNPVPQSDSRLSPMDSVIADPTNPQVLYSFGQGARAFSRSEDGGSSWNSIETDFPQGSISETYNFRGALAFLPSAPGTAFMAMNYYLDYSYGGIRYLGLLRTTDSGRHWAPLATQPSSYSWYRIYANAATPSTPETITASGRSGIFRSTNGGATWTLVTLPDSLLWTVAYLDYLLVDPTTPQVLYLPLPGRLLKSSDGGASWTLSFLPTLGLPYSFVVDPAHPQHLYMGFSDSGVYGSFDGGAAWLSLNGSSPLRQDAVLDLELAPAAAGSRLLAAQWWRPDLFVAKLTPQGSSALWSTYLGTSGLNSAGGLAVNSSGIYLASEVDSAAAFVTPGAYSAPALGSLDIALFRITDSGTCSYSTPPAQELRAAGGDARFTVVTGAGCPWMLTASPAWTVVSQPSGNGLGQIEFAFSRNTTGAARSGVFVVSGQTVTVTQPAMSCPISLSTASIESPPQGDATAHTTSVVAGMCNWTAQSDSAWLSIQSGSRGIGHGSISLLVAPNSGSTARAGEVTILADTGERLHLPVVQSANGCSTTLNSFSGSIGAGAGSVSVPFVSTPANCSAWSAASSVRWARPVLAAGAGSSIVTFSIDANPWPQPRQGIFSVGGHTYTLTQAAGSGCAVSGTLLPLLPVSDRLAKSTCYAMLGGDDKYWAKRFTFEGKAGSEVAIQALGINYYHPVIFLAAPDGTPLGSSTGVHPVIRRFPFSGYFKLPQTGTYVVEVTSTASPYPAEGDFKLQLEERCDVTPSTYAYGIGPEGVLSPLSIPLASAGHCSWTTLSLDLDVRVGPPTGSGNGTATIWPSNHASLNSTMTYPVLLGGELFYFSAGNPSGYVRFTPSSVSLSGAAQTGLSGGISTTAYTPRSTAPWLTFTAFPSSTTFTYAVEANLSGAPRSAQLLLGDSTFTVTQAAVAGLAISGTVKQGASPLSGVRMALSGGLTAATTTNASGAYTFAGLSPGLNYTVTPSLYGLAAQPASASFSALAASQTANFAVAAPAGSIVLGRPSLTFAATNPSYSGSGPFVTPAQSVALSFTGAGTAWTASSSSNWVTVSPASGVGAATLTVSLVPAQLPSIEGLHKAAITITAGAASNSPRTLLVSLQVLGSMYYSTRGAFETPLDGASVASSIPVTGWALNDIGVTSVKIYRDPVPPETSGSLVYIGDATFVPGARPDVEAAYPEMPRRERAGWGYMLLTNALPGGGNGTFKLSAIATSVTNQQVLLGTSTIVVDNLHATRPFGALATPQQGATVSGSAYLSQGWALTPQPAQIPTDGSTIRVFIDGALQGTVAYNNLRADVQTLFPGYANSAGAGGYRVLDTTALSTGLHTIAWSVRDSLGRADGVGSRYFTVLNESAPARPAGQPAEPAQPAESLAPSSEPPLRPAVEQPQPAELVTQPAKLQARPAEQQPQPAKLTNRPHQAMVRTGWDLDAPLSELGPLSVEELDRIEINLPAGDWTAYERVAGERNTPPVGSRLDSATGQFTWQLGPGFLGRYELEFASADQSLQVSIQVRPRK